jgi:hypothetical protein
MSEDSTVELPDLSSDNKELTPEQLKIKQLEETVDYLKKALDVALKHEPTFVYEHCGHCAIKSENN